jgi:hypothetical protein
MFLMCSWGFGGFGANKFNDLANKHLAPKAEVTGSNPVGCANDFNGLRDWFEGSGLWFVRIILVVVAPLVSAPRIAHVWKLSNWNTMEFAGKSQNISEQ